ncbi:PPP2R1A-PPP2R2A-interacting phosphatase regulator 1 isoform X2 [Periplaneta americana]|uniref:PPP2R1A-PPP2R2A-interacting phosphatase regulator 1 isoform X2 n=1 Tax=Periplaneta americana TaxID=6978 RepID=UPI0037E9133E
MDVDSPVSLKRSSSAPMINELNTTMTTASTSSSTRDTSSFSIFASQPRTRRFSASFSPGHSGGPSGPPRHTPRVSQLKQEDRVDMGRETAHEREVCSAMQMSQSYEDLTIMPGLTVDCKSDHMDSRRSEPTRMILPPLQLNVPNCSPGCSSPSPTRPGLGRQFSPNISNVPPWNSLSPSPTRKYTTRCQSPINMRPSSLGPAVKRKFELEEEKDQYLSPPTKRPNCYSVERGGLLMAHSRCYVKSPSRISEFSWNP